MSVLPQKFHAYYKLKNIKQQINLLIKSRIFRRVINTVQ